VSQLSFTAGTTPHSRGRQRKDAAFKWICSFAALLAAVILVCVLVKIFSDGADRVDLQFLKGKASELFPEKAGILPALAGSAWIIGLTILISVPIGVGSAIYLEEFSYKRNKLTDIIEINIANLSGVPSIIYGLLGLAVFSTMLGMGNGILVGGLTMTLLVLPMVILVSREALKAVPNTMREGALALGATRWQMIIKTVIPAALPGILTGLILSVSRAIGEVAPLIVVGAVGFVTFMPESLGDDYTVLPLQIFDWARRPQEEFQQAAAAGSLVLPQEEFQQAAAAGSLVLLAALLLLNSVAIIIRSRAQKKQKA
jgi:phosphate transport system permease protein